MMKATESKTDLGEIEDPADWVGTFHGYVLSVLDPWLKINPPTLSLRCEIPPTTRVSESVSFR